MNPFTRRMAEALLESSADESLKAEARRRLEQDEAARERRKNKKAHASRGGLGEAVKLARRRVRDNELAEDLAKQIMHERVFAWNVEHGRTRFGECDCGCGTIFKHADDGEVDHWTPRSRGGAHTRENGWRLAAGCHEAKHAARPSVAAWNRKREAYCERAGIPFVAHRDKAAEARAAQKGMP